MRHDATAEYTARRLKAVAALWLLLSLLLGAAAMYAAWQHNPMGEIYNPESGQLDWAYWLAIGLSWFVVCGALPVIIGAALRWLWRWFRS